MKDFGGKKVFPEVGLHEKSDAKKDEFIRKTNKA